MTVYVDDGNYVFGRMRMCHMIADSREELFRMVDRIGVRRQWIQDFGTWREHFDVCRSKRDLAIKHGAVQVTQKELVRIALERKEAAAATYATERET